jgi:hypothetical protein
MNEQNHGRTNESRNRLAVIALACTFLVAFGTSVSYVPAWFGEQSKMLGSWVPQLLLLTVKLTGQSLWDCMEMSTRVHRMTISVACTMVLGLVIGWAAARKRRTAL